MLKLDQKMINLNDENPVDIMTKISHFLFTNLKIRSKDSQS